MKSHGMLGFGMGMVCGGLLGFWIPHTSIDALPEVSMQEVVSELDLTGEGAPVLVIDVGDASRAAAVRAAIADERVIAETPHGFALQERRLVVSSLEEAGAILTSAGWDDEGLQILRFEPVRRDREAAPDDERSAERLAELMKKPTLSYFEAQQALTLL